MVYEIICPPVQELNHNLPGFLHLYHLTEMSILATFNLCANAHNCCVRQELLNYNRSTEIETL